jgi:hypothetical protein
MARPKVNGSSDKSGSEIIGNTIVADGANEHASTEDIRGDEESVNGEIFNPADLDGNTATADSSGGEPWFPKRNKRTKKGPRASKEAASDLNGLLWMIHAGLAEVTGIEELILDPKESEELSKAIARVQAFYPTSILSPIAMAWTGLIVTAGKVYGTRVIAYTAKKKKKPNLVEIPLPPGTAQAQQM